MRGDSAPVANPASPSANPLERRRFIAATPGRAASLGPTPVPYRLLLWTLLPIALGLCAKLSGLDLQIADVFFSVDQQGFPARANSMLELVGHRSAKSIVLACWFVLFGATVAAHFDPTTRPWRPLLWATVIGMALGPLVVSAMKSLTAFHCPWDLVRYAGYATDGDHVFVAPSEAGQCFPAGHSAGGFSLFALYFGLRAAGQRNAARWALLLTLVIGAAFSYVRVIQGAHFVSHTLWAAGVDWLASGLPICLVSHRSARRAGSGDELRGAKPPT